MMMEIRCRREGPGAHNDQLVERAHASVIEFLVASYNAQHDGHIYWSELA